MHPATTSPLEFYINKKLRENNFIAEGNWVFVHICYDSNEHDLIDDINTIDAEFSKETGDYNGKERNS